MKYAALMFDIVESRQYQDRLDVQNILIENIRYLNYVYGYSIKKEVVPSAGDEFQGLFTDIQTAFLYARKLQLLIYPIKIRSGIGYGEIKYDIDEWSSSAFDGDAYYLARDAINAIPKRKGNIICFNTATPIDKYLNMYCLANAEIKSKQSQIARWIELLADIICPLNNIVEERSIYYFVLESRNKIINQERWNKVTGRFRELELVDTNFEFLFENKGLSESENTNFTKKLYLEDFWFYGMTTCIAQAMNTSRQNIDRYVSLGRIKESRTMDKSIFELLGENI